MESDTRGRLTSSLNPQRLKFIIENFASLQGLNFAIFATAMFLFDMGAVWRLSWWGKLLDETLQLGLFIIFYRGMVKNYYERRFGRVEPKPKSPGTRREAIGFLLTIPLLIALFIWGPRIEAWLDVTLIGDPKGQVQLPAVVVWMMWVSKSIRRDSSMDPRGPFFYVVGLAVAAAIAFYPKWHPEVTESMLWKTLNTGSLWLTFVAFGLRDHLMLVRALPKNGSDDEDGF